MEPLGFSNFFNQFYIIHTDDNRLTESDQKIAFTASFILGLCTLGLVHLGCWIAERCIKPADPSEKGIKQESQTASEKMYRGPESGQAREKLQDQHMTEEEIYEEIKKTMSIDFKTHDRYHIDFAEKSKEYLSHFSDLGSPGKIVGILRPAKPKENFGLLDPQVEAMCIYLVLTNKVESCIIDRAFYQLGHIKDYKAKFPDAAITEVYTKVNGKLVQENSL